MKKSTQEKSLLDVNKNGIFYKIKSFFIKLFHKNQVAIEVNIIESNIQNTIEDKNTKNLFMESIRNIENEETKLLKLQKQYRNGEIKEEELTEEQVNSLCVLYDKQIENLKNSNQIRKQKLLEYRRKLQSDN